MLGYVDLHCHWLPSVDDGVRSADDGIRLLRALREIGFDHVVATPHIRPALFDNRAPGLRDAYAAMRLRVDRELAESPGSLPETSLACEHFFDDTVFELLLRGEGLPYRAGRSALIELSVEQLPIALAARLFDLRRKRLRPIIAHPERYSAFWQAPRKAAEKMRRAGGVLLMDVAALDGKYGSKAMRAAEELVEDRAYYAACSDAHRPDDAVAVERSIERLGRLVGGAEVERLLKTGPREILEGKILDAYD